MYTIIHGLIQLIVYLCAEEFEEFRTGILMTVTVILWCFIAAAI